MSHQSASGVRSPVGGLVLAGLFGGVGILFGGVHGAVGVAGWAVHGVEDEWVDAGVAEVVPCAGWHGHQIALGDGPGLAGHVGLSAAADESQDLVGVLVGLGADVPTWRDGHDDELD